MAVFYLVRHGYIDYAERVPGRQKGIFLSDRGRAQAGSLVDMFSEIEVDNIYSSPLERTMETAHPLAEVKGCGIQKREELIEIDFGEWTGMLFDELESDTRWKNFHSYRNGCVIPGGELMIQVQLRMIKLINELCQKNSERSIVLISHNDPIKSVLAYFLGISLDQFLRINISTGSVSAICLEKNSVKVLFVNRTDHIPCNYD